MSERERTPELVQGAALKGIQCRCKIATQKAFDDSSCLNLNLLNRSHDMGTCAAAAGTLQNLSREAASRQLIRQQGAVPLLAALLSATDLQARASHLWDANVLGEMFPNLLAHRHLCPLHTSIARESLRASFGASQTHALHLPQRLRAYYTSEDIEEGCAKYCKVCACRLSCVQLVRC